MAVTIDPAQTFVPVIVGTDTGAYGMARAFHREYGARSVVVSRRTSTAIRWSRIVEHSVCPGLGDDDALVTHLRAVAADLGDRPLLLVGSVDELISRLVHLGEQLTDLFVLPYPSADVFDSVVSKDQFAARCAEYAVGHPPTRVVNPHDEAEPWRELDGPWVLKAVNNPLYDSLGIEGMEKVHYCATETEVRSVLAMMRDGGYGDDVIVQTQIPGSDEAMAILTCYVDRSSRVRMAALGHVLLEERSPATHGNPACIVTELDADIVTAATRLLEGIGWRGYANFDIKRSPTGEPMFFELNPRLGRSNFYVAGQGGTPARWYVDDWLSDGSALPAELQIADDQFCYTVAPLGLLHYYLSGAAWSKVWGAVRRGRCSHPLLYGADLDPRRVALVLLTLLRQWPRFLRWHPRGREA